MRNYSLIISCLIGSFILAGCTQTPAPMGRGYVAYADKYKSAPGEEPEDIGYVYNNEDNETVLEDMRYAARDLIERLDQKLSFSVDEVYLQTAEQNAFYSTFDHLLRNELTRQGYLLANTMHNAVHVGFVAAEPKECAMNNDAQGTAYRHLYLALQIYTNPEMPPETIGGFYEVPTYGNGGKSIGFSKVEVPSCMPANIEELSHE